MVSSKGYKMSADNWCTCPKCGNDFREDYEIGLAQDGTFIIDYYGSCSPSGGKLPCGLVIRYELKKNVDEVKSK